MMRGSLYVVALLPPLPLRSAGLHALCWRNNRALVAKKRLRRTENVRGTFEGVSAPREFAQPSLLSKHRTPYG